MEYIYNRPPFTQFLGNVNTREVHDLRGEKSQCDIDTIIQRRHAVTFTPDMLEQALAEGFDHCRYCLGEPSRW